MCDITPTDFVIHLWGVIPEASDRGWDVELTSPLGHAVLSQRATLWEGQTAAPLYPCLQGSVMWSVNRSQPELYSLDLFLCVCVSVCLPAKLHPYPSSVPLSLGFW